jgi:hypothetical protein
MGNHKIASLIDMSKLQSFDGKNHTQLLAGYRFQYETEKKLYKLYPGFQGSVE